MSIYIKNIEFTRKIMKNFMHQSNKACRYDHAPNNFLTLEVMPSFLPSLCP